MIKPKKLKRGDTVAIVSLSSGSAGDELFKHRYIQGKKRLEEVSLQFIIKETDFYFPYDLIQPIQIIYDSTSLLELINCC